MLHPLPMQKWLMYHTCPAIKITMNRLSMMKFHCKRIFMVLRLMEWIATFYPGNIWCELTTVHKWQQSTTQCHESQCREITQGYFNDCIIDDTRDAPTLHPGFLGGCREHFLLSCVSYAGLRIWPHILMRDTILIQQRALWFLTINWWSKDTSAPTHTHIHRHLQIRFLIHTVNTPTSTHTK